MRIHLIAAVADNGVIGANGNLPWNLPADLQHFKELTMHHTVIMGRRTYESIGKALPGRQNIVVSTTVNKLPDCQVAASLEQALAFAEWEEVFIIGGGQLYRAALPLAQQLNLTWIAATPWGDTFFPEVCWEEFIQTDEIKILGAPSCRFVTYQRKQT